MNQIFQSYMKSKTTLVKSSEILHHYYDLSIFTTKFKYKSIIRKLNYLERGTRSDISHTTH